MWVQQDGVDGLLCLGQSCRGKEKKGGTFRDSVLLLVFNIIFRDLITTWSSFLSTVDMVYNVIITEIVRAKIITLTDGIYCICVHKVFLCKEGLLPSFEGHSLSVWPLKKVVKWLVCLQNGLWAMDPVVVCPTPHSKEKNGVFDVSFHVPFKDINVSICQCK